MASLLPHKELSVELKSGKSELAVLADGQPTEASNRDKLLKAADPASVALKYKDIIGMKRADRRALIKGMKVVYIYHDTIDDAGHQENSIFSACDTAIDELKNMCIFSGAVKKGSGDILGNLYKVECFLHWLIEHGIENREKPHQEKLR